MTDVAIVGCGAISRAYAPSIAAYDHLDLVACADLEPARAARLAEKHGIPRACTVDEVLADPTIDVVVNLTPPLAHEPITRAILESGRHAYSEKPLGTDLTAARGLVSLAAERGLRLGCAPDTFLGVGLQTAAAAIADGAIGTPVGASAFMLSRGPESWHPSPDFFYAPGGGPLFDMGPYYLTALVQLLGPARRVTAMTSAIRSERTVGSGDRAGETFPVEVPTHVATTIELASGPIATLTTSFDVTATRHGNIEVYGTEATLVVPDPNYFEGTVLIGNAGNSRWDEVTPRVADVVQQRGTGLADMAWAERTGRAHRASGDLALHVVELMTATIDAADEGRTVELTTTCTSPALLPVGLAPNTFDD